MIRGIGLDLVELDRVYNSLIRFNERFLTRILTLAERTAIPRLNAVPHVAGLFAAKEAAVKALGTGFSGGIGFHNVEINSLSSGQPTLRFLGKALEQAQKLGASKTHISLTHSRNTAAALVVLED